MLALWKEHTARLAGPNQRNVGESLADPTKYENLFPGWADSLKVSELLGKDETEMCWVCGILTFRRIRWSPNRGRKV